MGKTNAQEREALQKIEEILEDFSPEDTYIGKAFDGCVEQVRANFVNDGLESWKGWYLDEQMKNCRLSEKVVDLTKQLNQKDDAIARYEGVVQGKDREISRLNGEKTAAYTDLEGRLEEAQRQIIDLRQTILELKAKLYDTMTGEEVEE